MNLQASTRLLTSTIVAALLAACGGSDTPTVTLGGNVSGLGSGNNVVLQNQGHDAMAVAANGAFTFSFPLVPGSPYNVTVFAQPLAQTCQVSNGAGTAASTNISNVAVVCSINSYTVEVVVAGLTGAGLVLKDNGGDNLSISANGSASFATSVKSGLPYAVTVLSQPAGQLCSISGGSGTVGAAPPSVHITCAALPNSWNWVGGSSTAGVSGTYGTLGTAAASNFPGARYGAVSWTDSAGNAWLLGGQGYDSAGTVGALSDLWEYSAGQWKWVGGANTVNARGVYGTRGSFAAANIPGARFAAISWIDSSGNVWLAGGQGYDSAGTLGLLNDLWEYSAGQWRWVSGSNIVNATGVYGSLGTPAASNIPGARFAASSWLDSSGNMWVFGGIGYDSTGNQSFLNDLWEYSAGQWIWVSGSDTANEAGTYGTVGVAALGSAPGARLRALTWTDTSGNLWLFGGLGFDASGSQGGLNDLWEYSAGLWTWVGGADTTNASGTFGTKGVAATANAPSARYASISWADQSGNVWVFGGQGFDSSGNPVFLNDLWKYSGGQWTWVSGSNLANGNGSYGSKGTAAVANLPGARYASVGWVDSLGSLWLLGGVGYDGAGSQGGLNDLWTYTP